MTEQDLYKLIDEYRKYGVNPESILGYEVYNDNYLRPIGARIEDLKHWNPVVAGNKAKEIAKLIRMYGDRALNTYPGLVKNNLDVFFPDGAPEDALDDYEVDKYDTLNYVTLENLQDPDMGYSPEEFAAYREALANDIVNEQRKLNEFNKSPEGKKLSKDIIDMLNSDYF